MIIKDKIQIGGIWWNISFEKDLKTDEGQPCKGFADLDYCYIKFDDSLKEELIDEQFWHELLHVLFDRSGYRFGEKMKHDHTLIEGTTTIIHQVMNQIIEWQFK